jgi:Arc/MetJ family transcription regulator
MALHVGRLRLLLRYARIVASEAYNLAMTKRTSLNLDMSLVEEAREVLGTRGTTETVNKALAEVVRQDRLRRLTQMVFDVDNDEVEASWSDEIDLDEPLQLP